MSWTQPQTSDFQTFFYRDFQFATTDNPNNLNAVMTSDISRAMTEALDNFNTSLFSSDAVTTNAFMYLTAFCLVRNIMMSTKGLSGQNKFMVAGVAVGGVSTSFAIPEQYMKDPFLASLTQNQYGQRYLELILPYLVGNITTICGGPQQ